MNDFISAFCRLRPFLFHLAASSNLDVIRTEGVLYSAKRMLEEAGQTQWLGTKRPTALPIDFRNSRVMIRDQAPLHRGNICFKEGMNFEAFIESLNAKVFFWPGSILGPISYGKRHYDRYRDERPAVLRIPTVDLIKSNPGVQPLFCRFNSGSPRCSGGLRSPRGGDTFLPPSAFGRTPSRVVEVVFEGEVELPPSTEYLLGGLERPSL